MMDESDSFGAYEIEEVMGRGSMGVVYRARHELTHREVALKVLFPNAMTNEMGEERFKREIRVAAMVDDDGIVDVFDAGAEGEEFYYAMELLDGLEFEEVLEHCDWREGLVSVVDVTASLAACHEAGVIHRDLKPENIFIVGSDDSSQARTKLLDFGMASVRESPKATQTGFTLGTPSYMSPEQAMDATDATPASDVWSIGVILYELIVGELPFKGESSTQVMLDVVENEAPPVEPKDDDIPEPLVEITERCLEKDPDERFPNARPLHAVLREVYEHLDDAPALPSTSVVESRSPSQTPSNSTSQGFPQQSSDSTSPDSSVSPHADTHAAEESVDVEADSPDESPSSIFEKVSEGSSRQHVAWIGGGIVVVGVGLGVAAMQWSSTDSGVPSSSAETSDEVASEQAPTASSGGPDVSVKDSRKQADRRADRAKAYASAVARTIEAVERGRREVDTRVRAEATAETPNDEGGDPGDSSDAEENRVGAAVGSSDSPGADSADDGARPSETDEARTGGTGPTAEGGSGSEGTADETNGEESAASAGGPPAEGETNSVEEGGAEGAAAGGEGETSEGESSSTSTDSPPELPGEPDLPEEEPDSPADDSPTEPGGAPDVGTGSAPTERDAGAQPPSYDEAENERSGSERADEKGAPSDESSGEESEEESEERPPFSF